MKILLILIFTFDWHLTDKMKRSFFQAAAVSILLYGCTTWTHTKRLEKKLDGNFTRMLRAILNKSWQQHPTRNQLYGHLPPITKTIQVRRTRHAGHCWRSRDELISDVLLWTPTKAGRPARTYILQLCEDTGFRSEDLPEAMNDREKWRERVREIPAGGTTWWWWYTLINYFPMNQTESFRKCLWSLLLALNIPTTFKDHASLYILNLFLWCIFITINVMLNNPLIINIQIHASLYILNLFLYCTLFELTVNAL